MGMESVSPMVSANMQDETNAGSQSYQSRISELQRMEQDVRKMKTDYRQYAKQNNLPQSCIVKKMSELDKLISNIEQQITLDRQNEMREGGNGSTGNGGAATLNEKRAKHEPSLYSTSVSVVAMGANLRSVPISMQVTNGMEKGEQLTEESQAVQMTDGEQSELDRITEQSEEQKNKTENSEENDHKLDVLV